MFPAHRTVLPLLCVASTVVGTAAFAQSLAPPFWAFQTFIHSADPRYEPSIAASAQSSCEQHAEDTFPTTLVPGSPSASQYVDFSFNVGPTSPLDYTLEAECSYEVELPSGETQSGLSILAYDGFMFCDPTGGRTTVTVPFGDPLLYERQQCQTFSGQTLDERNRGEQCDTAGNPISIGIGNKFEYERDVRQRNVEFGRYYNSSLGLWRHDYQRSLEVTPLSDATIVPEQTFFTVRVQDDDGRELMFTGSTTPDGTIERPFRAQSDDPETLVPTVEPDGEVSAWTLYRQDGSVDHYDAAGVLQGAATLDGRTVSLVYGEDGVLASIVDHTGESLSLEYDEGGALTSVADAEGHLVRYVHDAEGRLTETIYPDATPSDPADDPRRTYHYEDPAFPNALTGLTNENGDRFATWAYDEEGQAILSEHAGGVGRTDIVYDSSSITVTNALGRQTVFTTIADNGLIKTTDVDGLASPNAAATSTETEYDSEGYPESITDENGNVSESTHDERGQLVELTQAVGTSEQRTTTSAWHDVFRVPISIAEPGRTTVFAYDASGRVLSRTTTDDQTQTEPYATEGRQRTTTYTYGATGPVETVDGPRTDVEDRTTYTYDARGDLTTITNALGHVVEFLERDTRGLPTRTRDVNGLVRRLAYDARGRLVSTTAESSQGEATTRYEYDAVGQLVRMEMPLGSELVMEYDAARRLVAVANGLGERVEYTRDLAGNLTEEVIRDSSGVPRLTRSRQFDELSRTIAEIGAAGQTVRHEYDPGGNRIAMVDGAGERTTFVYDALDRRTGWTDPNTGSVQLTYDARDNRASATDANGVTTSFVHDGFDQVIQESSPDVGTLVHEYDEAGNRVRTTDARGVVSDHAYDALNRRTSIRYPASPSEDVVYTYDEGANGVGHLTGIADASGTTAYGHDDRGNVVSETRTIDGRAYVVRYEYDLADRIVEITYPSGRTVSYGRDTLGRVVDVTTVSADGVVEVVVSGATYEPFGPSTGWTFGNGVVGTRTWDSDYRLERIEARAASGAGVLDRSYGYALTDDVVDITDHLDAARTQSFAYDAVRRLESATGIYGSDVYGYDAAGNRTSWQRSGGPAPFSATYAYDPASHRLTTVERDVAGELTTRTLGYSASGQTTSDETHDGELRTLTYGNRDRLMEVSTPSGLLATYQYDALGRRVRKGGAGDLHFVHDLEGRLIAEVRLDGDGDVLREYVYGPDHLAAVAVTTVRTIGGQGGPFVGRLRGTRLLFVHTDHRGAPLRMTDDDGEVVWAADYDPFGEAVPSTVGVSMPLRLPGQYHDPETGLHQNHFRDYDPDTGRYLQVDPTGLEAGLDRYVYAEASPIVQVDPMGLDSFSFFGQFSLFVFDQGATAKAAYGHDSTGRWCFTGTTCFRGGVGASTGASCGLEYDSGDFAEHGSDTLSGGVFGNVGRGPFGSVSVTTGGDGVKTSGSLGGGIGFAFGGQGCVTRTYCF